MGIRKIAFVLILTLLFGCDKDEAGNGKLELLHVFLGEDEINLTEPMSTGLQVDRSISLVFSTPVNQAVAMSAVVLKKDGQTVATEKSFLSDGGTIVIYPEGTLENNSTYTIDLSDDLVGASGETFSARQVSFKTTLTSLAITSIEIGDNEVPQANRITNVPLNLNMKMNFSIPVNSESFGNAISVAGPDVPALQITFSNENKTATITTSASLQHFNKYTLTISGVLKGSQGEGFTPVTKTLYTVPDESPKLPVISDEALLTLVQEQTFKYFWDFAHPTCGMARERNTSGDVVTAGGTGFGLMAILVGIERNFISRSEGIARLDKIVDFLATADRFHGAWPHWMNGSTGDVIPFSADDDGGDLVETAFLVQGLLTVRQYLNPGIPAENELITNINTLWENVEWDWYTQGGQDVLYWHWSPNVGWKMNHAIRGHNETLITYVLASSSPTHGIDASVYHNGYARSGAIQNGKTFYSTVLPLGEDYGGPLFFSHYSFLGLDPRNLADTYANYWTQNVNHTLINRAYAIANPKQFVGYSENNWGLTASDNHQGYSAHSPKNDLGVITPTAALSSFPYTPEYSMDALKFFYYTIGDKLWGPYGFYDAFNPTENWYADSYLAIDQGPIIVMIENYKTGLLWDQFMSAPEVQNGLTKLGFTF